MQQSGRNYKRIVIKVGSSILDAARFSHLAQEISSLMRAEEKEVVLVSSGAIALGMNIMNLKNRPKELGFLQAAAAIGQNALMDNYSEAFAVGKIRCGQVLLTWDDFDSRKRYLSAKNTLLTLLKLGVLPVVNENDTISTDEIKFGDNDRLSALVATLVDADLLIILSDVDGLWDENKKIIKVVAEINSEIKKLACPTDKQTCVGGMVTKIDAAKIAVGSGIPCVIANGRTKGNISTIVRNPEGLGNWTLFLSKKDSLDSRKRWIAFGTKPKGKISVDDGAKRALVNKKSLLSVGIVKAEGNFDCDDIISIVDLKGNEFARGKSCISCRQLDKVKGSRYDKEIVHCDNIVIL